jgi:hypothetical protein
LIQLKRRHRGRSSLCHLGRCGSIAIDASSDNQNSAMPHLP